MPIHQHVIISRTDNIGDVVLTLPLALLLKKYFPKCRITFLGREYVKSVIFSCPYVDHFLSFDYLMTLSKERAAQQLKELNADAILHVFPNKWLSFCAKKAGIPLRVGTSHRWYHLLACNNRINFTRKNSPLHEAQLNFKLLAPFEMPNFLTLEQLKIMNLLNVPEEIPHKINRIIDPSKFNLIVHPGTNGNTKEWPIHYFLTLINMLDPKKFNVILTGLEHEKEHLIPLIGESSYIKNAVGTLSLAELITLIGHADGLLANSTGPLHIAAACHIHALGLFPLDKATGPDRWQPLGKKATYLVSSSTEFNCMETISPEMVKEVIEDWLLPVQSKCL